ncbi:MAG TPA: isoleucine--tRNA ligase [Candidatus Paceibacterota bacterium]|nr:isoleucine--tRNA ligase [Verrucomicrobiota bacterium]HSA12452.1 isoleucine--tRNA ligase [Candidatus Paceibacterota bacterium]
MDYKNTLNLPQTDFPMKADLVAREPARLKQWEAAGLYAAAQAQRVGAEKFILHDGPPFANGDVHIGTALNKILKDIIVKYKTLRGFSAPYVPGWDCHGLPIEFKVTQDMRKAGDTTSDAAAIRKACEAYARKYIDIQRGQFKRLGVLGDWDNPYRTLNKGYEAEELRLFANLVEQGFIYRGKKPVYWSIPCRTALAEAEVEYKDHVSQSVYVKFPLAGHPGTSVVIWTTTPWTLPANLAIAYNSTFSYSLVLVGQEQYIVSALLLPAVAAKCGWQDYQILRSLDGGHLGQMEYQHPFCNRTGKFFRGDSFVDNETGTGFVHCAPGHGLEDYHLGTEQGLPIYSPVDDDGRFAYTDDLPQEQQMPAGMIGKSILEKHGKSDANEVVLHELRARKVLLHQENYPHSYPHCWRSKTPIIFRAMDQWFVEVDHASFRERALAEINRVEWVPDWGKSRIEAAIKGRPDWCISRQRTWGVPIPAFYDAQGRPILDAQIVRNAAALFAQHGSNVWFEKSAAELWAMLKPADWKGPVPASKSNDTLDVWIDSGSSSRSVLMQRPELRHATGNKELTASDWQADMYLEGSDQHRGWFQSSLLLSLAGNGATPFKTVLTHGFMVDADREKISKSKQAQSGYEKPQTADAYVKKWGADIVRLWVASQDFRDDIIVSEERISKVAETYRVLRNALRYQLANLYDFDPAKHAVPDDRLTGLDRWMLGAFSQLEREVLAAYDRYEFHVVYQKVSQFVAVELSAIYHDVVKDRLYTDPANSPRRRSTQTALHRMVGGLCKMLAPILAFTADEAWAFVPGKTADSAHLLTWEPLGFQRDEAEKSDWKALFELRAMALPELEKARQAKAIGKALEAKVTIAGLNPALAANQAHLESLRELLNVSQLEIKPADEAALAVSVAKAAGDKCERCWHWETDVGSQPEHPTLCARCAKAVQGLPTA